MAGDREYDETAMEDGGMTGPGAPTPLSALEVNLLLLVEISCLNVIIGRRWSLET
jgi:hypothetical protein